MKKFMHEIKLNPYFEWCANLSGEVTANQKSALFCTLVFLFGIGLAGCPEGQPCETSSDCQAGEICSEGICATSGNNNNIVVQDGVGPEGGTVLGPNGERLVIPAGALSARYVFTFEYLSSSIVVSGVDTVSRIYAIDPQIPLLTEAQLEVAFPGGECDEGCYLNQGNSALSEWSRTSENARYPDSTTNVVSFPVKDNITPFVVERSLPTGGSDGGSILDAGDSPGDAGAENDGGGAHADAGPNDAGTSMLDDAGPVSDAGSEIDAGDQNSDAGSVDGGDHHDGGPVDPGPCLEDTVCAPEVCNEDIGLCVECTIDDECGAGQLCNMGTWSCYTGCSVDDDCAENEECDLFFGQCISISNADCELDSECQAGEFCEEETQTCQPIVGCLIDDDCMLFEECNLVTNTCESTIENPCDDNEDCNTGFYCDLNLGGSCEQIGTCVIDEDCTGLTEYCSQESFTCEINLECIEHGECELGEVCNSATNQCVIEPCSKEMPNVCPGGLVCDVLMGRCQELATCWDLFDCVSLPNQICDIPGGSIFYDEPCGPDPDADGGVTDLGEADGGQDLYVCEDSDMYCREEVINGVPSGEYYCHLPGECVENE